MNETETVELLREAVRLLRILAAPQIHELRQRFEATVLTSANRRAMWDLMDGTRSLAEVGRAVGTSSEAVRQFFREVQESFPELVETVPGPGPQRPARRMI